MHDGSKTNLPTIMEQESQLASTTIKFAADQSQSQLKQEEIRNLLAVVLTALVFTVAYACLLLHTTLRTVYRDIAAGLHFKRSEAKYYWLIITSRQKEKQREPMGSVRHL